MGPPQPSLLSRALAVAAVVLAAWAIAVVATGGVDVTWGGLRISSRNPVRPALVALILGFVSWRRDRDWFEAGAARLVVRQPARLPIAIVAAAAAALLVAALVFGVRAAAGADATGYVSQSLLWLRGDVTMSQPLVERVPWPNADWTFTPLGYRPGADHTLVPTYPAGLPLLMAATRRLSACGPYLIAPISGALLVVLTAMLGWRVFGSATGTAGAVMTAASPVVLWWTLTPMTDVPVAACWIAALLAADRRRLTGAAAAGMFSGLAVAIRPNLAPLAVFPLLLSAVHGGGASKMAARAAALAAALLPFVALVAWTQQSLFGSPFTSGYGTISSIYSAQHAVTNVGRYATWWWQAHGVLGWLFLVALFRRRPSATRARAVILILFAAAVALSYVFYLPFDTWAFLRFLLPALPIVLLLGADALVWIGQRNRPIAATLLVAACTALAVLHGVFQARWNGFFRFADDSQSYADAAVYLDAVTPRQTVVLAMQHSGSVRYYSGRDVLRYDVLGPEWLDRALDALEHMGFETVALFEDWEEPIFRSRFAGQASVGLLDRGPVALRHKRGGEVRLFSLRSALGHPASGPGEIPHRSRFDCIDGSPHWRK